MRRAAGSAQALITAPDSRPDTASIPTVPSSHRLLLRLAVLALIAVLTCTGEPVSAAESASTTTQTGALPTSQGVIALAPVSTPGDETITARLGPAPQTPAKPAKRTRRRHHHLWFWHLVPGSGGPLSWLLLVPYLIVALGLAAILIFVRRRRTGVSARRPTFTPSTTGFSASRTFMPPACSPTTSSRRSDSESSAPDCSADFAVARALTSRRVHAAPRTRRRARHCARRSARSCALSHPRPSPSGSR